MSWGMDFFETLAMYLLVTSAGAVVALLLLSVCWERRKREWHLRKSRVEPPPCLGSDPSPQSQAENECISCPFVLGCLPHHSLAAQIRAARELGVPLGGVDVRRVLP
jgi:hypothetical protein